MRTAWIAAAALAMAALAGCGSSKTIDHVTLEKAIEVSVARQRHLIVIVACPKGIEAKKGVKFHCTATAQDGRQYQFKVTGTNDNGDVRYVGLRTRARQGG